MERELAEKINAMFLRHSSELNGSVAVVRKESCEEEVEKYLKPVSHTRSRGQTP